MKKTLFWSSVSASLLFVGCGDTNNINHAPSANAQVVDVMENISTSITLSGNDIDKDSLTYSLTTHPLHGTITGTAPLLAYQPEVDYLGSDSFAFKVNDGKVDSSDVVVAINVHTGEKQQLSTVAQALLGPLSDAHFKILKIDDNTVITEGQTTKGDGKDITSAGLIQVHQSIKDGLVSGMYLLKISGGEDIDTDDNGIWDEKPTKNEGEIHAVISNSTLKESNFKVNILTEVVYQNIKDDLENKTKVDIENLIDKKSKELLAGVKGDINGDGNIDGSDLIAWNPSKDKDKLSENYENNLDSIATNILQGIENSDEGNLLFNNAPIAKAGSDKSIVVGDSVTFDASESIDSDGNIVKYEWKEGENILSRSSRFTKDDFAIGAYTITLKVTDDDDEVAMDAVVVTVSTPENTLPTANSQSINMNEDSSKAITLTGNDADGDNLSYTITTNPSHGTLSGTVPNLTYTPTANYFGSDSFTYKVNDGKGYSADAVISIMIADVAEPNTLPTANSQSINMNEDSTKAITLTGNDVDGDNLSYTITTNPSHGTLSGTVPNLTYTPTANYFGSDSFTYKVNDGKGYSADAVISIVVNSVNDAPTVDAGADRTIPEGKNYTPILTSSDSDGTIVDIVWREGNTIVTFPKNDFSIGAHTLFVTVRDNGGLTSVDSVILTVVEKLKIKKTGQTIVYTNYDDGHYQKGATPYYTRDNAKEIVTDHITKLQWQDSAVSGGSTATANWSEVNSYCQDLTFGGYSDWRLATYKELGDLRDFENLDPAISSVFVHAYPGHFWTSTQDKGSTASHWVINFKDAYSYSYRDTSTGRVRCVRDGL